MKKRESVFQRIFGFFFKGLKKRKAPAVRRVWIGLRGRLLFILSASLFFILLAVTLILYLNQRMSLENEKRDKAAVLTRVLSRPAELFLDKDKGTTAEEAAFKLTNLLRDSERFLSYYPDIRTIFLYDTRGVLQFAFNPASIRLPVDGLLKKAGRTSNTLSSQDARITNKNGRVWNALLLAAPLNIQEGPLVQALEDYEQHFNKIHENTLSEQSRRRLYADLYKRYAGLLPPVLDPAYREAAPPRGKPAVTNTARGDLDYLFFHILTGLYKERQARSKASEAWITRVSWLDNEKAAVQKALQDKDMPAARAADSRIMEKMNTLRAAVEALKPLGTLVVSFDTDVMRKSLDNGIVAALITGGIVYLLSVVLFFFLLTVRVRSLKKMEKWALEVSAGELGKRLTIQENDEIGRLSDVFNQMMDGLVEKYHLEKFVSRSTRSMIGQKSRTDGVDLGKMGRRSLAFIFSDVRGFTSFSEKHDPETVIETLNGYFELQSRIIKSRKGDIDDYVGDQIMAHFGGEKRADTALDAAVQIMREVRAYNEDRKKQNLPVFEVGIGVHMGDVVVGNIGSGFRMDFACIGDAVNLTSRLCSAAAPGETLASAELYSASGKKHEAEKLPAIQVKGKEEKIAVYRIQAK